MTDRHTVQQCRWAEPTLFLDHPSWPDAADYPWSCLADGDPEAVRETERCLTCGRWSPRDTRPATTCRCADRRR